MLKSEIKHVLNYERRNMEKGIERKKELLTISLDEFITKGFYGTSTREICRRAGISSGLLFHYFPNKESIYLELVKIGIEKMYIDTEEAMRAPEQYLFHVLCEIFSQLESNPFFAKMYVFMDRAQHIDTGIDEVGLLLEQADIARQWIPVIEKGQEIKCFHAGSAHAMCVALFGAVQGIAQEKVRVPQTPLPDAAWLMKMVNAIS